MLYNISWPGKEVKLGQRVAFVYRGNLLFGIVRGFMQNFYDILGGS